MISSLGTRHKQSILYFRLQKARREEKRSRVSTLLGGAREQPRNNSERRERYKCYSPVNGEESSRSIEENGVAPGEPII